MLAWKSGATVSFILGEKGFGCSCGEGAESRKKEWVNKNGRRKLCEGAQGYWGRCGSRKKQKGEEKAYSEKRDGYVVEKDQRGREARGTTCSKERKTRKKPPKKWRSKEITLA